MVYDLFCTGTGISPLHEENNPFNPLDQIISVAIIVRPTMITLLMLCMIMG